MAKNVNVKVTGDVSQYVAAMKKAADATGGLESKAAGMQQLGAKLQTVGRAATIGVTLPLVGAGAAAVKLAGDFDASMTKIVSLVGIGADEVDGMRESVLGLSGETARSPQELADALFVITSAGLRGEDAMGALEYAAKASAAGLGETRDVAQAVASTMNAYGPDVLDAAAATDILTATARAGNFETSQLAGALGRVLPFASQAGVAFEEVGGAVALLTRLNGDAAQSVTQVQGLMRSIVTPTAEARNVLGDLGLSIDDVRASIDDQGLVATLQMLEERMGGSTDQFSLLFGGAEGAAAAIGILDADAQTLADTFGVVGDAAGITGEAFAATADSDAFRMQQAMNDLRVAMVQVGEVLLPIVSDIAGAVSRLAGAFSDLDPGVQKVIVGFAGLAAAGGPALVIAGSLLRNFRELQTLSGKLGGRAGSLGKLGAAIGLLGAAFVVARSAVDHWQSSATVAGRAAENMAEKAERVEAAVEGMTEALRAGTDPSDLLRSSLVGLADSNEVFRDGLDRAGLSIDDLVGRMESGNYGAGTFTSSIEQMARAAGATRDEASELGDELYPLIAGWQDATDAVGETNEVLGESAEVTDEATEVTHDASDAMAEYEQRQQDAAEAAAELRDLIMDQVAALEDQVIAMRSAADSAFALRDAEDDHRDSVEKLNDVLNDGESDLRDVQQAQDDVASSAGEVADATVRLAEEQAAMHGQTLTATERLDLMNESLLEQAANTDGPARTAILNYIGAINDIPPERLTDIIALLDEGAVEEAETALNDTSRARRSTVTAEAWTAEAEGDLNYVARDRTTQVYVQMAGMPTLRDAGGWANAGDIIAERGPEIFDGRLVSTPSILGRPGYVTGREETARMLAGLSSKVDAPAPSGMGGSDLREVVRQLEPSITNAITAGVRQTVRVG